MSSCDHSEVFHISVVVRLTRHPTQTLCWPFPWNTRTQSPAHMELALALALTVYVLYAEKRRQLRVCRALRDSDS